MADDVPVTDILCEAMEYLSKLGANLRSRSENLKEKRIRKDKLKNAHAVTRAAQKVLTICELSKKSLDNVESGVKRILSFVDAAQAVTGDGGKTVKYDVVSRPTHSSADKALSENRKKEKDLTSPKTVHVSGKKYTLKFPRKVNLKHYLSVKVLAKSMHKTMVEKYPVYYNCKLYRNRERKALKETNSTDGHRSSVDDVITSSIKGEGKTTEDKESDRIASKDFDDECLIVSNKKDNNLSESKDVKDEEKKSKTENGHKRKKSNDSSDSEKSTKRSKGKPHSKFNKHKVRIDEALLKDKDEKQKVYKHKRILIVHSSSESDEDTCKKSQDKPKAACLESEDKPSDTVLVEPNEISSVEAVSDKCSKDRSDEESAGNHLKKKSSEEASVDKQENKAEKNDTTCNSELNENAEQDIQPIEVVKPLIKCVSLTKLLKPDVLSKDENIIKKDDILDKEAKKSKKMLVHMNKKGEITTKFIELPKTDASKSYSEKIKEKREKELIKKNKQLAAFVPKFSVYVTKLPILSVDFLHEHHLKRITQNGSIVCEIVQMSTVEDISVEEEKNDPSKKNSLTDDKITNEAKHALLYDSDGENIESSPKKTKESDDIIETEKNKNSLLNDSEESDKNEETQNSENNQSISRNAECNIFETDGLLNEEKRGEKTPEKEKTTDDQDRELAKSSLLYDSSGSSSKSPDKKIIKKGSAKKSHRKHIMESMHAKKMLLTYSSSSDTEDEQLKTVIKDIKDSLIKNMENDDEANKCLKKKLLSSSDSDDVLEHKHKHIKKKRKISKSKSQSPEIQAEESGDKKEENKAKSVGEDSSKNDHSISSTTSSSSKMGRSKVKAGGSSSQNSDTLDDKDIEGLTNLKSLTNQRRRRDSDSDEAESTSAKGSSTSSKKEEMSKLKHFSDDEGLLEAPDSSGEASAAESDGPDEDLPPISLPGLNGGSLSHLAKDDLLGESESDSSKEKGSDDKKDTDSESDAVKSKRRKANTISSDSEAGSSRRKEKVERISDFEDSEDENSEPIKRAKRKKKGSDSDASAGSSSDSGKKKRRRIKQLESDVSGSDSDVDGKNKHGRKNIRKVMGKNQLEEATKKAAREEKERVARIMERQKMYNNLEFDETGKPDEVIVDKVVLDFDPSTKEPLIEVDRGLVKKLKPHQANGIKFMWDACFESVKRIKKDRGSGCILAHCMGLGKTLQVVSLTHSLLIHSDLTHVNRVLVVCPLSTVLNWVNEFKMWLKHAHSDYEVDVYELSKFKQNSERAFQLSSWFSHGGVCVLGYEMFRNLSADNPKKFKKKMLKQFQESLVDPGPDLVVCDEGHLLKNEKTSLSQSMNRVKTRRRIVLTGTPLQNNLKEYYCMVQFVKPNLLGKYNEYLNRFVNPITNGQYTDSTEYDIKVMKRRSHVLHKMLDGAVQRRDYGVLAPFLPPKHEYVLFITLTEVQVKLYQHYLDNYSRRPLAGKSSGFLFPDFQSLQRIWTHPLVLKYNSERYEIMQQKKREREEEEDSEGSLVDFIDDDSTPDETSSDDESDSLSDVSDDSRKKKKKKSSKKNKKEKEGKGGQRRGTRANPIELGSDIEPEPLALESKNDNPTEWWIPLVTDDEIEDMRNSHKLVLLFEILRQCEAIGDKLLVFSQSLYSLDLIEHFLGKVDEATQEGRVDEKLGGHVGSWSPGIDYFRLDGSTSCENRSIWCKNFNREDNPRARLFLISTRAGGLGINLVAANRVVIFDVSWNPSHDVQSIFRVYRFGQKKPCYIYRFLAMGTMEEKIYERQVTKQAISKRVIDEQQIDRHYAENDLAELYKFEPKPPSPRPVPLVPKDRLFAEMLKEREHVIYKFHEHDSLLENKEEETLSEEERKAAWDDFENEKNRPPPQPFPSWPMHNGMGQLPNLLAQQQQQLAYAALAQMLRKDMPNITDDNIRAMLPLIYSSNPQMFGGYDYGLMQKLSSLYAQPGMMNPAMMNPAMNVGAAQPGMGGGGSSGLQYEPPWQRQQTQQQQMRLQQLMQQQQNQMGAKLYAGGLGSRDPIAMALQQQRAREIMMSGGGGVGAVGAGAVAGAGRPRGRPPLQPRAPPAPYAAQDVVNLDSD